MADDVVPLMPLGLVLLPGYRLPVHVFEQRYRHLLADVRRDGAAGSFGVVALRSGMEVRADEIRDTATFESVGTVAEIVHVHRYSDDGSWDLLTVGSRRFRIRQLIDDRPYLRAHVDYLGEDDGDLGPHHVAAAQGLAGRYDEVIAALTGRESDDEPLPEDAWLLSYRLAATLPLPLADRQALLETATTAQRLQRLTALLRRELALLQHTRTVAVRPSTLQLISRPN